MRRYRVIETIGRGGFGTVYKAEALGQGGFSKTVALKVLNDAAAEVQETSQRLRDEARMLGLLRHRAIVATDGMVQLDGHWTVVMEYIEGVDLKTLLTEGPIPPSVALEIIQEVASALYVAYERPTASGQPLRLLHRDIKPSNIQLTAAGEVKVLDFGVARAEFESREARTAALAFGSLAYMAPERLEGEDSHAGDVYALGAVLYELVVGEALGKTPGEPTQHQDFLSAALDRVWAATGNQDIYELLADCLSGDAARRPPARELERRARDARAHLEPVWLSDWAERIVPNLLAARQPAPGEMTGAILSETVATPLATPIGGPSEPDDPYEPTPPYPRFIAWVAIGAAVLSALVVIGLGGGVLLWMNRPGATGGTITISSDPAGGAGSSGGAAGAAAGSSGADPSGSGGSSGAAAVSGSSGGADPSGSGGLATGSSGADPAGSGGGSSGGRPSGSSGGSSGAAVVSGSSSSSSGGTRPSGSSGGSSSSSGGGSTARRTGMVVIQSGSDIPGVTLVRNGKSYPVGRVAPGTYTVRGTVGGSLRDVGTITVSADQTVTLVCKARFGACASL